MLFYFFLGTQVYEFERPTLPEDITAEIQSTETSLVLEPTETRVVIAE